MRGAAAVALGEYADAQAVEPLTSALADKSEFVRAQAAHALGTNARAAIRAVPSLIRLLTSDQDQEVRRQAAHALGQIVRPSLCRAPPRTAQPNPSPEQRRAHSIERIKQK